MMSTERWGTPIEQVSNDAVAESELCAWRVGMGVGDSHRDGAEWRVRGRARQGVELKVTRLQLVWRMERAIRRKAEPRSAAGEP